MTKKGMFLLAWFRGAMVSIFEHLAITMDAIFI